MAARRKHLLTVGEVLEVIGDRRATELLGLVPHAANMWRERERLPPNSYVLFTEILESAGHTADPLLWSMKTAVA
jgi:hypothetical protein